MTRPTGRWGRVGARLDTTATAASTPMRSNERFFGWVEDVKGVQPWPHQEEAIMDLLAGDHVILNTPTGSGKSLVALAMHFAALCTGRRFLLHRADQGVGLREVLRPGRGVLGATTWA